MKENQDVDRLLPAPSLRNSADATSADSKAWGTLQAPHSNDFSLLRTAQDDNQTQRSQSGRSDSGEDAADDLSELESILISCGDDPFKGVQFHSASSEPSSPQEIKTQVSVLLSRYGAP
jgi:hypothetical protein